MSISDTTVRKIVETTGSLVERLLPKSIHAVTAKGFELKVALFANLPQSGQAFWKELRRSFLSRKRIPIWE